MNSSVVKEPEYILPDNMDQGSSTVKSLLTKGVILKLRGELITLSFVFQGKRSDFHAIPVCGMRVH